MLARISAVLCEPTSWRRLRAHLIAPLAASLLALSACGDGGGIIITPDDPDPPPVEECTATTCGEVRIGLTDADGDFLSYAVDVVSLKLERSNGSTVETLPTRQRVDFADLVDVTEFVTSATIPNGTYVSATITLDYGDADVTVESAGLPIQGIVVDEDGDALGVVDVEVTLDNANRVVIASGTPALLQLDFDLAATHTVAFASNPATVTAEPFLTASIVPLDAREFRVRGPLQSVDEAAGSYVVDLRPFNHPSARLGEFTVLTTSTTTFEVDGEALNQAAGLAALAVLPADAPTVAHGVYDVAEREFTADRVLAGDSVPGAAFDGVIGNVVARDGDELIVRGGTVIRTDDEVVFARGDITVVVGEGTLVTQDGSGTALDTDAISVGQRIHALGEATTSDVDPVLDARDGRVRLHLTHVAGTVVTTTTGEVTMDLFSIDGRTAQFFDFTGTGGSILTDADPFNYEIDTGALDLDAFELDDPMQAFGFMTPFGAAPPDFTARTLVSFDNLRALLAVGYGTAGSEAPFISMGTDGFQLDPAVAQGGTRQLLKIGPRILSVSSLPEPLVIEPATTGRTMFAVVRGFRVEVFQDFAEFAERVSNLLNGGSNMRSITARGLFDEDETTLAANTVTVTFTVQ